MSVSSETELAIAAADHLGEMDRAAVAALRQVAAKIDAMAPEKFDNVTLPTFLRYCSELGLTPAGRKALETLAPLEVPKKPEGAPRGSRVAQRRSNAAHLRSA